jgi:hypothetical protein
MPVNLFPILSTVPFNSNVAFNNSWITVDNDQNRALFAQATYITNISDIRREPNKNGFTFIDNTEQYSGNFETLKVVADCKFAGLTADNTDIGNLSAYEIPQGFEITGEIYGLQLQYGAVIAYNAVDIY